MAGKRRDKGRPMRRTLRLTHRTRRLNEELAVTSDPRDRVMVAVNHYRSALAVCPDPDGAERIVQELVRAGDRLYARKEGGARVDDGQ